MHPLYLIENTSNKEPEQLDGPEYNNPDFYPNFQHDIIELKNNLIELNKNKKPYVVMRVYDGEFHFLNKRVVGNGPKRHYSKPLTDDFIKPFQDGCYKVDILSCQLNINMLNQFNSIIPNPKPKFIPMDIIYGLFANKWILSNFKNKIALIGGNEKMNVIQELMKHKEYQDYVCNDYFIDYISVPERFSCDNTDSIAEQIGTKIKNSNAEVFLFGIGISKMAIAHKFKNYKDAIFIDIGCGMSGLAGSVETDRPYFGSWNNYRIKTFDYSKIDPTNFNIDRDNAIFL
jgi:hypothetical protein|tara:strand:+ start:1283 stop:2143 length:861 start_codon:yes stop_codon:yes gene_type:complete